MENKKGLFVLIALLGMIAMFGYYATAAPSGGTTTSGTPETAPVDAAGSADAYAGNVTEVTISGYSTTQSWQGFYGNVSGAIELTDASNNTLYNWTLASPQGEVYASTNDTGITWTSIQCFNFTANGTGDGTGETPGATNFGGVNLSVLESRFGIGSADTDGVNETFAFTVAADQHDEFFTGALTFSSGECPFTLVYDSSGQTANTFEEALLYEPTAGAVIFASLLEQDASGFDSGTHDFEMLVLEDGHSGDTSTTTYYFFVELE